MLVVKLSPLARHASFQAAVFDHAAGSVARVVDHTYNKGRVTSRSTLHFPVDRVQAYGSTDTAKRKRYANHNVHESSHLYIIFAQTVLAAVIRSPKVQRRLRSMFLQKVGARAGAVCGHHPKTSPATPVVNPDSAILRNIRPR